MVLDRGAGGREGRAARACVSRCLAATALEDVRLPERQPARDRSVGVLVAVVEDGDLISDVAKDVLRVVHGGDECFPLPLDLHGVIPRQILTALSVAERQVVVATGCRVWIHVDIGVDVGKRDALLAA